MRRSMPGSYAQLWKRLVRSVLLLPGLSSGLLASYLGDDLLITHIGLDRRLSDEEDHYAHEQRNYADASNPKNPLLAIQQWRPWACKGYIDSKATGNKADQGAEVEYPVRSKPGTCKGGMVLVTNNDHINEQDHHRDAPDHRHRCLENVVHDR